MMEDYTEDLKGLAEVLPREKIGFLSVVYALAMADGVRATDWETVNTAITERWGATAVDIVKAGAKRATKKAKEQPHRHLWGMAIRNQVKDFLRQYGG